MATGRRPRTRNLGLEKAGVLLDDQGDGAIKVIITSQDSCQILQAQVGFPFIRDLQAAMLPQVQEYWPPSRLLTRYVCRPLLFEIL